MKVHIRTPFFEIGVKNYLYGDSVLKLAESADKAAEDTDLDVLFICPYTEIRRVSERCPHLIVFAPYMDLLHPGPGLTEVLPEALKDAGAKGVIINHSEHPMTIAEIMATIKRANELDMLTFACADTISEAKAMAILGPDIINPEPTELIGGKEISSMSFVSESIKAVKDISPRILVEQAAGISQPDEVMKMIQAGADGVGVASGICKAPDPSRKAVELIHAVNEARNGRGVK